MIRKGGINRYKLFDVPKLKRVKEKIFTEEEQTIVYVLVSYSRLEKVRILLGGQQYGGFNQ